MSRLCRFFGAAGVILLVFGQVVSVFFQSNSYWISLVHTAFGVVLLAIFLFSGGISFLKTVFVSQKTGRGAQAIGSILLFSAIVVAANIVAVRHDALIYDGTEQKIYTLAPETLQLLESLRGRLTLRGFYLAGKIPNEKVSELLRRLEQASSKLTVEIIDPEKAVASLAKYGITQAGTLHFTLETPDGQRIAKLTKEPDEQAIAEVLRKLLRGDEKTVYFLDGHDECDIENGVEPGCLFLKEAIEGESYHAKKFNLRSSDTLPKDAVALIVAAPKRELHEAERIILRSYIESGGKVLFFTDPKSPPDVRELVRSFGIIAGNDLVVDQMSGAYANGGLGVQPVISKFGAHPITEKFNDSLMLSIASSVRKAPEPLAHGTATELAYTGERSWAETNLALLFGEKPTAALEMNDLRGPVSVAAVFEGDGTYHGARIAVFGDSDFATNAQIRKLRNQDFILSTLNWVIGESNGIALRARGLKSATTVLTRSQMDNIFFWLAIVLPETMLLLGLGMRWYVRKE